MAELLIDADPKAVSPTHYLRLFRQFLEERALDQICQLVAQPKEANDRHCSFVIRAPRLIDFDAALAFTLIHHPHLLIPLCEEALVALQEAIVVHPQFLSKHPSGGSVKYLCHVRIAELPPMPELVKNIIGDISVQSGKSLLQVTGTIVRTGGVRMLELSKQYECQNPKCQYRFTVYADPEQDNMLPQPRSCPRPVSEGEKRCNSTALRELEDAKVCVDYQEVKLQDHIESLALGNLPRSIILILQADLVDRFHPGDDVIVVGRVLRQWRPVSRGSRCAMSIALLVNHMQALHKIEDASVLPLMPLRRGLLPTFQSFWANAVAKGMQWEARDLIVRAVCPQLCGMFLVKLCLLLTLIGGAPTSLSGGVKRRSEVHMLLVGDPGCGKSQILRFAASVLPRSVLTTGVGTTGAGLTCAATRDGPGGDWALEAGAMVLANGGVCCIDEFSSVKEADKAAIHEAMEQQSVSVAKAGLILKLPTRTTVVACCNPKGSYDLTADITANTAIASPLLSRFDIVLVLLDSCRDASWDKTVSTFLLMQALGANQKPATALPQQWQPSAELDTDLSWNKEVLGQYIACIRTHLTSLTLTADARVILSRYYQQQRQSEDRWSARTTIRLLESLLRLAEAHARLMMRQEVLMEDAIVAVLCVSQAQSLGSTSGKINEAVKESFALNPRQQYEEHERTVLEMLNYTKDRLQRDAQNLKEAHLPVDDWVSQSTGMNAFTPSESTQAQRPPVGSEQRSDDRRDFPSPNARNGQPLSQPSWPTLPSHAQAQMALQSQLEKLTSADAFIPSPLFPPSSLTPSSPQPAAPPASSPPFSAPSLSTQSSGPDPPSTNSEQPLSSSDNRLGGTSRATCSSEMSFESKQESVPPSSQPAAKANSHKRLWGAASATFALLGGETEEGL